jgi:hypothetical protein
LIPGSVTNSSADDTLFGVLNEALKDVRVRFVPPDTYLMVLYIAGCTALVSGVFQVLFTKNFRKNLPWHRV